jgi:hypothetical protein
MADAAAAIAAPVIVGSAGAQPVAPAGSDGTALARATSE